MSEQEEGKILTERRKVFGGIGVVLTGAAGMLKWANDRVDERDEWKEETLHPQVDTFLGELLTTEYDKIDTTPEGVDIDTYGTGWDGRGLKLEFETPHLLEDMAGNVDHKREFYEDPTVAEDVAIEQLADGEYLEEGADLFGIISDNFGDIPELDEVTVNYTTDKDDIHSTGLEYSFSIDEVGDNPEQQYRETIVERLE